MSWLTCWPAAGMVQRESWLAGQCHSAAVPTRRHADLALGHISPHQPGLPPSATSWQKGSWEPLWWVMQRTLAPLQTLRCSPVALGYSPTSTVGRQAGKGRNEAWRNTSQQRSESWPQRGLAPCSHLPAGAVPWGFHSWGREVGKSSSGGFLDDPAHGDSPVLQPTGPTELAQGCGAVGLKGCRRSGGAPCPGLDHGCCCAQGQDGAGEVMRVLEVGRSLGALGWEGWFGGASRG